MVLLLVWWIVWVEWIWVDGKLLCGSVGDLKVELGVLWVYDGDVD